MLTYSQYYKLVDQAFELLEAQIREARTFTIESYKSAIERETPKPALAPQPEYEQLEMPLDEMMESKNESENKK